MAGATREAVRWFARARLRLMRAVSPRHAYWNGRLNDREFWQGRTRLDSFPREVQIGTNLTCNLRCVFCLREHGEKERIRALRPEQREMSPVVLERLLKIAPYVDAFRLTPLGEPLMYSGLVALLERMGRMGSRNLEITTNGNRMDDETARRIVDAGTRRVYFSIDSADPELYAAMRVGGDLARATRGIEALAEWKRRRGSPDPEIMISATFLRRNIEGLPGLVRYAAGLGVGHLGVQLMEAVAPEFEPETLDKHLALTAACLSAARALGAELGVDVSPHTPLRNLLDASMAPDADTPIPPLIEQCRYPWTFLYVDPDGLARPCCWVGVNYGNLAEQSFDAVWNGPVARGMRAEFLAGRLPAYCRDRLCGVRIAEP